MKIAAHTILSIVLLCLAPGCGNQDPAVTAEQAKAKKVGDEMRAAQERRYDDQIDRMLAKRLEDSRKVVAQAENDIQEHTAALQDKNNSSTPETHKQLIEDAEKRKSVAEKEIKQLEDNISKKVPVGG